MKNKSLTRRAALGGAIASSAVLGMSGCAPKVSGNENPAAPAISKKRQRLQMVTTWPRDMPGLFGSAQRVADAVHAMTEGRIEIRVAGAGEIVPWSECFDAVADGAADMYHASEYYWKGKSPAFPFFTTVPFGMTANEIMGWIDFGGGQALWEELSSQYGIVAFQACNTGHQMGGWFQKEINSLDDFKGLKMRIPGQGGDVLRALGGSAIALAGGEIYQALQTNVIDATEWVGPWLDYSLGFHQEAKFYYGPGFHEPSASIAVGINKRVWDDFSNSDQAIIRAACNQANHYSIGEFDHNNALYLQRLSSEYGVKLRSFKDDIVSAMKEAAFDIRADSGKDGIEKRIYESFEDALKKARNWATVSDGGYLAARG